MLPSNTIRYIQNTIDSTESHNRRLETDQIWKQRDKNYRSSKTKTKRKRKRSEIHHADDNIDNDWHYQQQMRKKNAKRRKSNLESIMLGKWDHDKYDRMQHDDSQPKPIKSKKTIFDALESLKSNNKKQAKNTKSKKKRIESEPDHSDSDIDLSQGFTKYTRNTSNPIVINIKQKKTKGVNINIIDDHDSEKEKSKHSVYKKSKKKKKKKKRS